MGLEAVLDLVEEQYRDGTGNLRLQAGGQQTARPGAQGT